MKRIYENIEQFNKDYREHNNYYDDSIIREEGLLITNGVEIGGNGNYYLKLDNTGNDVSLTSDTFKFTSNSVNFTDTDHSWNFVASKPLLSYENSDYGNYVRLTPFNSRITVYKYNVVLDECKLQTKTLISDNINVGSSTLKTINGDGSVITYITKLTDDINSKGLKYTKFFKEIFNIGLSDGKKIADSVSSLTIGESIDVPYEVDDFKLVNYVADEFDWVDNVSFKTITDKIVHYQNSEIVNQQNLDEVVSGLTENIEQLTARIEELENIIGEQQN